MSLFFCVLLVILFPQTLEFWKQARSRAFYFLYLGYLEYQDSLIRKKFIREFLTPRQTYEASTKNNFQLFDFAEVIHDGAKGQRPYLNCIRMH